MWKIYLEKKNKEKTAARDSNNWSEHGHGTRQYSIGATWTCMSK